MAQGFSVSAPLRKDARDGWEMNKTYKQLVTQNLKMLLFTVPGERIMDLNFGVGLKMYLFEQDHPITHSNISAKIYKQVALYLPYLRIDDVQFKSQGAGYPDHPANRIDIKVHYTIKPLSRSGTLDVVVS